VGAVQRAAGSAVVLRAARSSARVATAEPERHPGSAERAGAICRVGQEAGRAAAGEGCLAVDR